MHKSLLAVATAVATLASLVVLSPSASASGSPEAGASVVAKVIRWIDGDTVVTNRGTVRLIGVDTPERGKCGSAKATRRARRLAPVGSSVALGNPRSVKTKDHYGRLLRYVNRGQRDVGKVQIRRGAWARYDSRDGYQRHPRQAKYRRVDAHHPNYCGKKNPSTKSEPKPNGAGVSGAVSPRGKNCPSSAPIKGNRSSMIYHQPGQRYYGVTVPEACFRNTASAEAAGYRAAKV